MGVESSDGTGHGRSDEVLLHIDMDDGVDGGLKYLLHDIFLNDALGNDALAPPLDPVDSAGLLVRAHVPAESYELHPLVLLRDDLDGSEGSLADHVHPHGVPREAL